MKFRPLHDRVVIRPAEGDLKSRGGIIIPDTAREKPQEGEVVAADPGDRVLFGKWSGTEVKIDGEDLLIVKEADIMGVVEPTGADLRKAA